jgi:hypothetical protein
MKKSSPARVGAQSQVDALGTTRAERESMFKREKALRLFEP